MLKVRLLISLSIAYLFLFQDINAQSIYLETGLVNAFFKNYTDSNANATLLDYSSRTNKSFFELGIILDAPKEFFKWELGLGYNDYLINSAFFRGSETVPITYNLEYITFKIGVNANIFHIHKFLFKIHGHFSNDWLVAGNSQYLNVFVNIHKDKSFDRTLLRYHIGPNINLEITKNTQLYLKYNFSSSFREKNEDSTNGEGYRIRTNAISIGTIFKI